MLTNVKTNARMLTTAAIAALMTAPAAFAADDVQSGTAYNENDAAIADSRTASQADGTDNDVTAGTEYNPAENERIGDSRTASEADGMDNQVTDGTEVSPVDERIADDSRVAADAADNELTTVTVNDLVGRNVMSADGEDIGAIDYVVDHQGEHAGVVGVGGFLGMGEHNVAIPMSAFNITHDGEIELKNVTVSEIEAMPAIDADMIVPLDDAKVVDMG